MELLLFILFVVVLLLFKSPRFIGGRGERKVKIRLERLIGNDGGFRVFHNLTLDTPDGTTQIDHIVLSYYGIFVIETKNLKGWIFGGEKQKQWTQTLYKEKYQFQNPLHQNYKHIKAVQNLLGVNKNQIFSIVVFVGNGKFKTEMPSNVLKLRELLSYIRSHDSIILSDQDINMFLHILNNPKYTDPSNRDRHIRNVRNNLHNPVCPRCGKPMVLRTARKGKAAGSKFWGCSGFPKCKTTKRVA